MMISQTIILRVGLLSLILTVALFTPQGLLHAQGVGSLPDLIVQSLTLNPKIPNDGDAVRLTATIANTGRGNVDDFFTVRFQIDRVTLDQRTMSGLRAHEQTTVQATWKATSGTHTIRVDVDQPFNEIAEADESNNALERVVTVVPLQGIRSLTGELLTTIAQGLQGAGQPLQVSPDPDLFKLLGTLTAALGAASEAFSAAALHLDDLPEGLPMMLGQERQLQTSATISTLYSGLAGTLKRTQDALSRADLQGAQTDLKQAADQLTQLSQISLEGITLAPVQRVAETMLQVAGQAQQLEAALSSNQSSALNQLVSALLGKLSAAGQQLVAVGRSTVQSASQRAVRFQGTKGESLEHYRSGDTLQIAVPDAQTLRWELFDLAGVIMVQTEAKKVARLLWNGRADSSTALVPSAYFYRVTVEDRSGSRVELGRLVVESPPP